MTAIQLRAELLRELNPIFDSEVAMQKALTALRDIRKVVFTEVPVTKPAVRKGWSAADNLSFVSGKVDKFFVHIEISLYFCSIVMSFYHDKLSYSICI